VSGEQKVSDPEHDLGRFGKTSSGIERGWDVAKKPILFSSKGEFFSEAMLAFDPPRALGWCEPSTFHAPVFN
jgi:hypothetical protein